MALLKDDKKTPAAQEKIMTELLHRINEIDRRLRINEQTDSNQDITVNNLNTNFVKFRKETKDSLSKFEALLRELKSTVESSSADVKRLSSKVDGLPTAAEIASLKTLTSAEGHEQKKSELDIGLSALEKLK